MKTIIQQAQIDNEVMTIHIELDPESPREWDNLGKMVCWHKRYQLGDKHNYKNTQEFQDSIDVQKIVVLPLYLYDHSGITMRTYPFENHWDSGQVGYIYATHEDIRKEFNTKRITEKAIEKTKKILRGEVEIYDLYLTGQVFGYIVEKLIKCETCGHIAREHIDSCWGFYGRDFQANGLLDHVDKKWKNAEWKEA